MSVNASFNARLARVLTILLLKFYKNYNYNFHFSKIYDIGPKAKYLQILVTLFILAKHVE